MIPWAVLEDELEMRGKVRPPNHLTGCGIVCELLNCEWCFDLLTSAEAKGLTVMTFEKFLQITYDIAKEVDPWIPESYKVPSTHTTLPKYSNYKNIYSFSVTWDKGGAQGGNCWGDEAEPYEGEPEPDDPAILDLILDKVFPQMTRLAYIRVKAAIMMEEEYDSSPGEYYGNYRIEGTKGFNIKDLYDALVKEGYGQIELA